MEKDDHNFNCQASMDDENSYYENFNQPNISGENFGNEKPTLAKDGLVFDCSRRLKEISEEEPDNSKSNIASVMLSDAKHTPTSQDETNPNFCATVFKRCETDKSNLRRCGKQFIQYCVVP